VNKGREGLPNQLSHRELKWAAALSAVFKGESSIPALKKLVSLFF